MKLSEERVLSAFEELEAWVFRERAIRFTEAVTARREKEATGEFLPYLPTDPDHFLGLDIGFKQRGGHMTPQVCVCLFVRRKLPMRELPPEVRIPPEVRGIPTDVIALGSIRCPPPARTFDLRLSKEERKTIARWLIPGERLVRLKGEVLRTALDVQNCFAAGASHRTACTRLKQRYLKRPVPAGVSIGHPQITAGTFGCLVQDGRGLFILSNNHVLANNNAAQPGDPILQPGPYDGGKNTARYEIGRLSSFVPIAFDGQPNHVDAALAETDLGRVTAQICSIGKVRGLGKPRRGLIVQKHGRTTGHTQGLLSGLYAKIWVDYDGKAALFEGQLRIEGGRIPFSAGGDSGSLIVDLQGRAVGLLFAGSELENMTFANPIRAVLKALKVRLVTGDRT